MKNKGGWYQFIGIPKQRSTQGFKVPKTEDIEINCVINGKKAMPLNYKVQLQLKEKNNKGEVVSVIPIYDKQGIKVREEITCSFNPSKLKMSYYDLEFVAHMIGPKSEVLRTQIDKIINLFFYEKQIVTQISEKPPALISMSDEDYKKKHYLVEGSDDMGVGWVDKKTWIHPRFPGHSHKSARVKEIKGIISKLKKNRQSLKYLFDPDQNSQSYTSLQNFHDRVIKRLELILSLYGSSDGMKRLKMDSTFRVGTINTMIKNYLNTLRQENWKLWVNYLSIESTRMSILRQILIDPEIKKPVNALYTNFVVFYDLLNNNLKFEFVKGSDLEKIKRINDLFKKSSILDVLMKKIVVYLKKEKSIKELTQYKSYLYEKKIGEFPGLAKA